MISVFDHECALVHLDSENKVEFVHGELLQIFDDVFQSISRLEEKLAADARDPGVRRPYQRPIDDPTIVAFLASLSPETTEDSIEEALRFASADKTALGEHKKLLNRKIKEDMSAQKALLREQCTYLLGLRDELNAKSSVLSNAKAAQVNRLLKNIREKKDIAGNSARAHLILKHLSTLVALIGKPLFSRHTSFIKKRPLQVARPQSTVFSVDSHWAKNKPRSLESTGNF